MRALVHKNGALSVRQFEKPEGRPGEALVRVILAGICNTDLEIIKGYLEFEGILGHEFVGIVEEAGSAELIGRRVVGSINIPCGDCFYCRRGLSRHCANMKVLGINGKNGAFAEWLALPESNLYAVPRNVSDFRAVFTEPLAAALQVMEQVHIRPDDTTIVLGDGKLGMLVAAALGLSGYRVTLVGKHRDKLALFERPDGLIPPGIVETRMVGEPLEPADLVIECTGRPDGLLAAAKLTRSCGTIVLKTTCAERSALDTAEIVVREITVLGSRCGPFEPALRMLERAQLRPEVLVEAEFGLDDGPAALERAGRKGAKKVLLRIG